MTTPEAVISQTWRLIANEASSGFWRAWTSLVAGDYLTGRTVNNASEQFATLLAISAAALLKQMDLVPTVTRDELGHLLAAAVQGLGLQLTGGADARHLEGAYAALWAAVLGLSRPRSAER
ncbi:MAG: hypothetical protein HY560_02510 [Gemmatimonadetes bacterium]|nr:hypothetical protein [Gemmatimonadota bacterium]